MEYLDEPQTWKRIGQTLYGGGIESLFIAFDGAAQVQSILRESSACAIIRVSEFCREDSTLGLDSFQSALAARGERTLVLGIGEYAALVGDWHPLYLMWAMRRHGKKFIAPIFNGYSSLEELQKNTPFRPVADPVIFLPRARNQWSYERYIIPAQVECVGFRAILQKLETGCSHMLTVRTGLNLQPHRGRTVETYGALYLARHPEEAISETMLSEEQWKMLTEQPENLDSSFFGVTNYLQLHKEEQTNAYLRKVLAKTKNHAQFKRNFIELLLEYKPQDAEFAGLAAGRHELAGELEEEDIQDYLFRLTKIPEDDRIGYLSPRVEAEKIEILKRVSLKPELAPYCPIENLAAYMEEYQLEAVNEELSDIITSHFQTYKYAKVANRVDILPAPSNGQQIINRLPARSKLVEDMRDPETKLYWVDALGCEYLAFLQHYAHKNHLVMKSRLGRVKLPSITPLNRDFYDAWPYKKEVVRSLDDIKHGRDLWLDREECKKWPLHLVGELEILDNLVHQIAADLKSGRHKKIILAADHGATRMAVIANEDLIWEMPEKGRYGGRCCPAHAFSEDLPANIVSGEDNAWLVITDYSRFRGSHQASVEVHGGATMEEAIVPIIEFSLGVILPEIMQITKREVRLAPGQQTVLVEIAATKPVAQPKLRLAGRMYPLKPTGDKKYAAEIPVADLQDYNEGAVYACNNRLSPQVSFSISRGVKSTENFDDFFE